MSTERRRLKAGIEVEIERFTYGGTMILPNEERVPSISHESLDLLTEPIPESPQVGDEVTWEWLGDEMDALRAENAQLVALLEEWRRVRAYLDKKGGGVLTNRERPARGSTGGRIEE